MSKVNELLTKRFKKGTNKPSKMSTLAEMSSKGQLSSFSGVFRIAALSENEREELHNILSEFSKEKLNITADLEKLSSITSEVKAINNQAAILHGERIKQAQKILKNYREGAFSTWLIYTYGNRQTPYNFLQYYELYTSISKPLQEKIDQMPRQAVYTLATRNTSLEKKQSIIKNYKGETKRQLLALIREKFPLINSDKRKEDLVKQMQKLVKDMEKLVHKRAFRPNRQQKDQLREVLQSIYHFLDR